MALATNLVVLCLALIGVTIHLGRYENRRQRAGLISAGLYAAIAVVQLVLLAMGMP